MTTTQSSDLIRPILRGVDGDMITVHLDHTSYEIRMHLEGAVTAAPGKRVKGSVTAEALRVHAAQGGGRFIEPVSGEPRIVAGVDLWLNLPRPPQEASGTSGMKVATNGGLNLSVLDGWWDEAYDGECGWAIASPDMPPDQQDDVDSTALYNLLENEVVPLFYDRGDDGIPHAWLARVRHAMQRLIPRFSAERMLLDYATRLYPRPPGPAA